MHTQNPFYKSPGLSASFFSCLISNHLTKYSREKMLFIDRENLVSFTPSNLNILRERTKEKVRRCLGAIKLPTHGTYTNYKLVKSFH